MDGMRADVDGLLSVERGQCAERDERAQRSRALSEGLTIALLLGLGVILLGDRPTPYLAAVGRATFLPDGERRYDLSLDVTFATVAELIRLARE